MAYQLRKSKQVLFSAWKLYKKKESKLPSDLKSHGKQLFEKLQEDILEKNRESASTTAHQVEEFSRKYLKKATPRRVWDFIFALAVALFFAILIRQVWFELYEIPTGSMRPTLEEKDRLLVSKTTFGINYPLRAKHILFDDSLVQRNGIFIFTGKNMDIYDVDTLYFYIFPGKKLYIKRLLGKPGDTLYFYGGQIYGMDKEGNDITKDLQLERLSKIAHVPFIYFEGKALTPSVPTNGIFSPVIIKQMNEPVAKMYVSSYNKIFGEMLPVSPCKTAPKEYFDLWGFKNYSFVRLLPKDLAKSFSGKTFSEYENSDYVLEITHHPSLKNATLEKDLYGRLRPTLGKSYSYLPLTNEQLKTMFQNLYTARFIVKNGYATRYGSSQSKNKTPLYSPRLPGIPDGTYEFYYGKAYQIHFGGIRKELSKTHPIYTFDSKRLYLLFNLGIEFDTRFLPTSKKQILTPSRYAYFKNQDLCYLDAAIVYKDDPNLITFTEEEKQKQESSKSYQPYYPFVDEGPPLLENGSLDKNLIQKNGLVIPDKHYLALGDNYAMSSDSRDFGLVPQGNIRGAPSFIFWPIGDRMGALNQPNYPWFNIGRAIIWLIALICFIFWKIYLSKIHQFPIKELEKKED